MVAEKFLTNKFAIFVIIAAGLLGTLATLEDSKTLEPQASPAAVSAPVTQLTFKASKVSNKGGFPQVAIVIEKPNKKFSKIVKTITARELAGALPPGVLPGTPPRTPNMYTVALKDFSYGDGIFFICVSGCGSAQVGSGPVKLSDIKVNGQEYFIDNIASIPGTGVANNTNYVQSAISCTGATRILPSSARAEGLFINKNQGSISLHSYSCKP